VRRVRAAHAVVVDRQPQETVGHFRRQARRGVGRRRRGLDRRADAEPAHEQDGTQERVRRARGRRSRERWRARRQPSRPRRAVRRRGDRSHAGRSEGWRSRLQRNSPTSIRRRATRAPCHANSQGGLADSRLAAENRHAALARAHSREESLQHVALAGTTEQTPTASMPQAPRGSVPLDRKRRLRGPPSAAVDAELTDTLQRARSRRSAVQAVDAPVCAPIPALIAAARRGAGAESPGGVPLPTVRRRLGRQGRSGVSPAWSVTLARRAGPS
jgi:hypothetical protein